MTTIMDHSGCLVELTFAIGPAGQRTNVQARCRGCQALPPLGSERA